MRDRFIRCRVHVYGYQKPNRFVRSLSLSAFGKRKRDRSKSTTVKGGLREREPHRKVYIATCTRYKFLRSRGSRAAAFIFHISDNKSPTILYIIYIAVWLIFSQARVLYISISSNFIPYFLIHLIFSPINKTLVSLYNNCASY